MPTYKLPHGQLELLHGDITTLAADAIVNAANSSLAGGGGVDGAIHRAAGPGIMRELHEIRSRIGHCPTGSAVVTSAGRLPARFIFHAVGPVYHGGRQNEAKLLASCYSTCLDLAVEHEAGSVAFPSISTGVYGYPVEAAAEVAVSAVRDWSSAHPNGPHLVQFVQFSRPDHSAYVAIAERILGSRA